MTAWGIHGERIYVLASLGAFMLILMARAWVGVARAERKRRAMLARWEREGRVSRDA